MAPVKFEEHIREQLDKREIQPSAGSWDKLNERLENTSKRPGRKWWYSAAAAAVVILAMTSLFLIEQQNPVANQVVEEPVEEPIKSPKEETNFENPVQLASEENEEVVPVKEAEKATEPTNTKSPAGIIVPKEEIYETRMAETGEKSRRIIEPVFSDPPKEMEEGNLNYKNQIEALLARIENTESQNGEISEAEVDILLAEAATEISRKEKYKGEVDANSLLADVEFEIDQSFRQEVFDMLKEGFLKARTAIATRNE